MRHENAGVSFCLAKQASRIRDPLIELLIYWRASECRRLGSEILSCYSVGLPIQASKSVLF